MLIPTGDINSIGFADISRYDDNFVISSPTFEITPPGYPKVNVPFTPQSANVYYASDFNISEDNCTAIPDGIYSIKYSVNPNQQYFIEKSVMRIDFIRCKYWNAFLKVDLNCNCNKDTIAKDKNTLAQISLLIEGSVAAANNNDCSTAYQLYHKADKMLSNMKFCQCN